MSRKRYTPEQIISMLREAEVALAQGQSVGQACRTLGVSEQSYYRWRKEFVLAAFVLTSKRLKDLEKENGRLRKAISDLTLDKLILKEALEVKLLSPARRRQSLIISRPNWESPSDVPGCCRPTSLNERKRPRGRSQTKRPLTAAIIRLAKPSMAVGYRADHCLGIGWRRHLRGARRPNGIEVGRLCFGSAGGAVQP